MMHLGAEVAERKKYFQTIGIGIWHRRSVPYEYSQQEIKVPHTQYGGGGGRWMDMEQGSMRGHRAIMAETWGEGHTKH